MTLSFLIVLISVIFLSTSPNTYHKRISTLVSAQFQDAHNHVAQHQVALTSDMNNILLDVLSPDCKTDLEQAMRSNRRYEISDDCKLELRTELIQADMIPPHLETEFMTNLNNHNSNNHHGRSNGGGFQNHKRYSNNHHQHPNHNQYAFDYKNNPILLVLFHLIVAIIMFLIVLVVGATYAVIFI